MNLQTKIVYFILSDNSRMNKVKPISINIFKKKVRAKDLDPFSTDLFNESDLKKISEDFGVRSVSSKIIEIIHLLPNAIKEPRRILMNLPNILKNHLKRVKNFYKSRNKKLTETYPFSDYALKSNIIAAFKPKKILEIGTFRGVGITAFKALSTQAHCYTMSPRNTVGANNEITSQEIGTVFRGKKIHIQQIWSDSIKFNFQSLGNVDVSYIDGNHKYDWVYSDLANCAKITRKMIMLDDYIPTKDSPRADVIEWGPWNADVVRAVKDFLLAHPHSFKEAYWLKNSPICVLIK